MQDSDSKASLTRRLNFLCGQLLELASELGKDEGYAAVTSAFRFSATLNDGPHLLALAQEFYEDRRRRSKIFPPSIFGEPGWDLLLDLYIAAKRNKSISVTSACIGSSVAATTALRWLQILEEKGLVERTGDNLDKRRSFIKLTEDGHAKMTEHLCKSRLQFFADEVVLKRPSRQKSQMEADATRSLIIEND